MQHKQWVKHGSSAAKQRLQVRICWMNYTDATNKQRDTPQVRDNIWSKYLGGRFVSCGSPDENEEPWRRWGRHRWWWWWLTKCYKRVFTWLVVCRQDSLLLLMSADASDGLRDAGMTAKLGWNDRAGRRLGFHWLVSVEKNKDCKWETTAANASRILISSF